MSEVLSPAIVASVATREAKAHRRSAGRMVVMVGACVPLVMLFALLISFTIGQFLVLTAPPLVVTIAAAVWHRTERLRRAGIAKLIAERALADESVVWTYTRGCIRGTRDGRSVDGLLLAASVSKRDRAVLPAARVVMK